MELGGKQAALFERLVKATERSAIANERLIALADEEQKADAEPAPPWCPHCSAINPRVLIEPHEIDDTLDDFALRVECQKCEQDFFVVPTSVMCVPNIEAAQTYVEMKKGGNGNGH